MGCNKPASIVRDIRIQKAMSMNIQRHTGSSSTMKKEPVTCGILKPCGTRSSAKAKQKK